MKFEVYFEHWSEPYWGTVNEERKNEREVRIFQKSLQRLLNQMIHRNVVIRQYRNIERNRFGPKVSQHFRNFWIFAFEIRFFFGFYGNDHDILYLLSSIFLGNRKNVGLWKDTGIRRVFGT